MSERGADASDIATTETSADAAVDSDATSEVARADAAGRARRAVAAVWRIESARIVATLARFAAGDVEQAEDLAQEALLEALRQWPVDGIPSNPGAWLTTVAKRRAIDTWRRRERLDARYATIAHDLEQRGEAASDRGWDPDTIDDDVLRLVFVSCHPVLSREAQVALTLRVVGGLTSEEIARAFLVPVATVQQRIVRAKKTLTAAAVPFEVPEPQDYPARLGSVLSVLYLVFNEGYLPASGEHWVRPDVAAEALRLARVVAALMPREPEAHGLVALMEFHASRFAARVGPDGVPIPLDEQDRTRWDRAQIERGRAALAHADRIGRGRASYGLQAAIAECHAVAARPEDTDWARIVMLYEALGRIAPSPVVELNRAVAVAMSTGPASALRILDDLARAGRLAGYPGLPAVRGEVLARLGRTQEARGELTTAARLTGNERERAALLERAAALGSA
ncbi:RNA polymerase sigma factor [Agromyces sp. Marseille-Q5079]|uniref:RNA polymerase sigma factor n=1 Tax=Agromyces sp. Marseille-Q5079 TaxID=3439059 RepID=UPI003D9CB552